MDVLAALLVKNVLWLTILSYNFYLTLLSSLMSPPIFDFCLTTEDYISTLTDLLRPSLNKYSKNNDVKAFNFDTNKKYLIHYIN